MNIRFANFKIIAGLAAVAAMVTVGAWGLTGTAQADDSPTKPKPNISSDITGGKSPFGGFVGGLPSGGFPTVPSKVTIPNFPSFPAFPTIPSTYTFP